MTFKMSESNKVERKICHNQNIKSPSVLLALGGIYILNDKNGTNFMNFSEAMFHENYLTSDFHTTTDITGLFVYSSKWRQKP